MKELISDLFLLDPGMVERERAGFRLHRLEVYNWGTFHDRVWSLQLGGENALVTGDIGSGKSTLVDALTSLLVPPQKISFNRAAGASARERTLRSYVLGHFKSERGESGQGARPVALRDQNTYSVILARFNNAGLKSDVTLAQVFWLKGDGAPQYFYVVADQPLGIAEDFADFGTDIHDLKKRLKRRGAKTPDSFPTYAGEFRRRFGIENEQALELFNQTVSLKSVGNLTEFVRQHMLEAFPVEGRIADLIRHFDDLRSAHQAVLTARAQIERLQPLIADCDRHAELAAEVEKLRECREALRPWLASIKRGLLAKRIEELAKSSAKLTARCDAIEAEQRERAKNRDNLRDAIHQNGGGRLEEIGKQIDRKLEEKTQRQERAERYSELAIGLGLADAFDEPTFLVNQDAIAHAQNDVKISEAEARELQTATGIDLREKKKAHDELLVELESLRGRRSNIPSPVLRMRGELCRALGDVGEDELPFAGELIEVRAEERSWEGAIERVLHVFGLSMLVPERHYQRVATWVDRTHLGARLIYFRVRGAERRGEFHPRSLVHRLALKPDSELYGWLESEVAKRFDYACCETLEQLRREPKAITKTGQIKSAGERHEKDDRHRIDDRSRFVLGWTNEAKIAALEEDARSSARIVQRHADRYAKLTDEVSALHDRVVNLGELARISRFDELDWRSRASAIHALEEESRALRAASNKLQALELRLQELEGEIKEAAGELKAKSDELSKTVLKLQQAEQRASECDQAIAGANESQRSRFARLDEIRIIVLGDRAFTVESSDESMRDWLQTAIDAEARKLKTLGEKIAGTMQAYRGQYPLETREADASVAAAGEYRAMLERLQADDLPRFERRFKELLNENTIREVAGFQSQLNKEKETIRERVAVINVSLRNIDYNPGRYIALELAPSPDPEIRDFQQHLRACTEGTLSGSEDDVYSEAKFEQVKLIVERLRGREGSAEADRRWTAKVTDVRNWFSFSASERNHNDDSEHEHYTDSGGKSGGQKEKLAYTVLAASLAYQFGLEQRSSTARSFRFVVIDEAFGRGSDESARYGLELFQKMNLQLLIVTPLQKIHIIEPHVSAVGFVHAEGGRLSMVRNLTIEEYRAERAARSA